MTAGLRQVWASGALTAGFDPAEQPPEVRDNTADGGGGGTMPPMDYTARLDSMDVRLDSMDGRLTRVEVKLDHVAHEVSNFKWYLLGAALTMVLAVIGTGISIQQMTVSTFQAAAQQAAPAPAPPTVIVIPALAAPAAPAAPASK